MKLGSVKRVQVGLTVELGRTVKDLEEVAAIGEGSVIELDRLCLEPVELFAAGTLIARGEVVVVGEKFALRVTELVEEPR